MAQRSGTRVSIDFAAIAKTTEPAIQNLTDEITARANAMFGELHEEEGFTGDVVWTDRPHGAVRSASYVAARSNLRHNWLLKAVHG